MWNVFLKHLLETQRFRGSAANTLTYFCQNVPALASGELIYYTEGFPVFGHLLPSEIIWKSVYQNDIIASVFTGHWYAVCNIAPIRLWYKGTWLYIFIAVKLSYFEQHNDVIKWKHFSRYWPFVREIHRSRWIPLTKASDAELWCFLWSAPE